MTGGAEALLDAVRRGDLPAVRELVDADPALVSVRDQRGPSAVLLAVYHGHGTVADWLVDRGAELNIYDAAALGRLSQVAALLEANPELARMHAPDGFSALGIAAYFGRPEALDLLLSAGADPNAASRNAMQVTPLHSACACTDAAAALRMTEALLAAGADPNVAQEGGWTPLHQAAAQGRLHIIEILLDRGAEAGSRNDDGRTPADMAVEKGHDDAAELLRRHGA